jgi:lysozyme
MTNRLKKNNVSGKLIGLLALLSLIFVGYVAWHYRYAIYKRVWPTVQRYRPSRIPQDFEVHGIDVSRYQGKIDWPALGKVNRIYPIRFVIIRATMGSLGEDREFPRNWELAGEKGLKRGAYHYYNPNQNSTLQAENFILTVDLKSGDLPPVLDIEELSDIQSEQQLIKGIRNWLEMVEGHYGVKPILYSSASFYRAYLLRHFSEYPLWVANYNRVFDPLPGKDWLIWQHTDSGTLDGIGGYVDLNVFNGGLREFEQLSMP